jgi:hypothetical protein
MRNLDVRTYSGLLAGAAIAPLITHGASLVVSVDPATWLHLSAPVRWSLAPDALLFTTGCVIVCAPVVGATVTASRRANVQNRGGLLSAVALLGAAVLMFTVVSALLTLGWRFGQGGTLGYVTRSHVTLAAVALALAAWGALCGAWFRNALDGAGFSLITALLAAGGLLVGGAVVADLPRGLIAAGLAANPLVSVASAADIDIVRSDVLYQISPLAHMQIDYPAWSLATACYLAVACICTLSLTATDRLMSPASHS